MRKFLCFIATILLSLSVYSQMWFPADGEWRYLYHTFDTRIGYNQMNVVGEETIDGILCKKIHIVRHLENITVSPPEIYIEDLGYKYVYASSDDNEVYVYEDSQFYKIYDFNAEIGETWTVPNCNPAATCNPNTSLVRITDKGTENVNGQELKWFEVETLSGGGALLYGKVYQKFGDTYMGFFPDYLPMVEPCGFLQEDAEFSKGLLCYTDSGFNWGTCPADILSVEDIEDSNSLKVYIDNGNLFIHLNLETPFHVSLFNALGEKLLQKTITPKESISMQSLPKGVYFVHIEANGKLYNEKLLWR